MRAENGHQIFFWPKKVFAFFSRFASLVSWRVVLVLFLLWISFMTWIIDCWFWFWAHCRVECTILVILRPEDSEFSSNSTSFQFSRLLLPKNFIYVLNFWSDTFPRYGVPPTFCSVAVPHQVATISPLVGPQRDGWKRRWESTALYIQELCFFVWQEHWTVEAYYRLKCFYRDLIYEQTHHWDTAEIRIDRFTFFVVFPISRWRRFRRCRRGTRRQRRIQNMEEKHTFPLWLGEYHWSHSLTERKKNISALNIECLNLAVWDMKNAAAVFQQARKYLWHR